MIQQIGVNGLMQLPATASTCSLRGSEGDLVVFDASQILDGSFYDHRLEAFAGVLCCHRDGIEAMVQCGQPRRNRFVLGEGYDGAGFGRLYSKIRRALQVVL